MRNIFSLANVLSFLALGISGAAFMLSLEDRTKRIATPMVQARLLGASIIAGDDLAKVEYHASVAISNRSSELIQVLQCQVKLTKTMQQMANGALNLPVVCNLPNGTGQAKFPMSIQADHTVILNVAFSERLSFESLSADRGFESRTADVSIFDQDCWGAFIIEGRAHGRYFSQCFTLTKIATVGELKITFGDGMVSSSALQTGEQKAWNWETW